MKKTIFLILSILVFACMLEGCKNEPSSEELLLSVLNNKSPFINEEGISVYIEDYKLGYDQGIDIIPQRYTFVDMDKDGIKELVTYVSPNHDAYIIFRYNNEKIYSFVIDTRSLIDLKEDGSFQQSEGAGFNTYARITFNESGYEWIEEAYDNDYEQIYTIEGKTTTQEDMKNFRQKWDDKADVEWIDVTD